MIRICIELKNNNKIYVKLFEDAAPITVANFMHLVDTKFYDELIFHRVIKGFMCQGGGYTFDGTNTTEKHSTYCIPGEFEANGFTNVISHQAGVISMARTNDLNSASNQFFICDGDSIFLDKNYAAFGVVEDPASLNIIHEICAGATSDADFPLDANSDNFTIKTIYRLS